jgi:hypothetical protein
LTDYLNLSSFYFKKFGETGIQQRNCARSEIAWIDLNVLKTARILKVDEDQSHAFDIPECGRLQKREG